MREILLIDYDSYWMKDVYEGIPLSDRGFELYCKKCGLIPCTSLKYDMTDCDIISRDSKILLEIVRELGNDAFGPEDMKWCIVEIPEDVDWAVGVDAKGHEFIYDRDHAWNLPKEEP